MDREMRKCASEESWVGSVDFELVIFSNFKAWTSCNRYNKSSYCQILWCREIHRHQLYGDVRLHRLELLCFGMLDRGVLMRRPHRLLSIERVIR